jgi:hypothetical protein
MKKSVVPLLKRLDTITGDQLLPALADGQFGFVLDGKWKSRHWQVMMPTTPKGMPMPELGILLGISDDEKFKQAMKGYFALINDALGTASELAKGQFPDIKLPEPNVEEGLGGLLAFYPIPPEIGLDSQFMPTAGLSKDVLAITLSRGHTERLLKATPLKFDGGPLAEMKSKPLSSAMIINWPVLIDTMAPWLEFGVSMAKLPPVGEGPDADVVSQVRMVLEVLKVLRSSTSVTYREEGATITHSETVVQDIE